MLLVAGGLSAPALAQQPPPDAAAPGAYMHAFDPASRVSLFGVERMKVNLEYAHGIEDNRGIYLKLGHAW